MAKFKINPLSSELKDVAQYENDTFSDIIVRCSKIVEADPKKVMEFCAVYCNGAQVGKEFWGYGKPKETDEVVIVLLAKGGDFGQIAKQVITVGATIAAFALAAPLGPVVQSLVAAGTAAAFSLGLNALIPPPTPGHQGFGAINRFEYDDSQVFTISGQSNDVKQYGNVPKVYGSHRFFPPFAATPYTEFAAENGAQVQYFYAIYDFGLGPCQVSELKIGDTPIENYDEVSYRFVDPNRPEVSEGVWDDNLETAFDLYFGDVDQESVNAVLNDDGDQTQRTGPQNPEELQQEITISFACPRGLTTIDQRGERSPRNIDLLIEFAEDGTEDWHSFSDPNHTIVSGENWEAPDDLTIVEDSLNELSGWFHTYLHSAELIMREFGPPPGDDGFFGWSSYGIDEYGDTLYTPFGGRYGKDYYGLKAGEFGSLVFNYKIPVGVLIKIGGQLVGRVKAHRVYDANYFYHDFDALPCNVAVAWDYFRDMDYGSTVYYYYAGILGGNRYYIDPKIEAIIEDTPIHTISGQTQEVYYSQVKFRPITKEQVKVRVTRDRSYGGYSFQVFDELTWQTYQTRFDTIPIDTSKRHTFLEVKIKATDQLNGTIQNLSGVVNSALEVYDGSDWSREITRNPAWVFVDLLIGEVNKKAIEKDRLHLESILEFADFCFETPDAPSGHPGYINERFECNFVLDFSITLKELLQKITNASQASLNLYDGKYGILIDKERTTPVQLFTPRNTFNFSANKSFGDIPHAIRVSYVSPDSNWEVQQQVVYNDGYDVLNSTEFDEVQSFACTNKEQAFRFGRYMLAQTIHRQETIRIDVDFEHLVCTRGDFVQLQQDSIRVGGNPARVRSISGNRITIDGAFVEEGGIDYGIVFRAQDGTIVTTTIDIVSSTEADVDGSEFPQEKDLLVWGEVDSIISDWIVKSIEPNDDLTATLTLVERAPEVYEAESSGAIGNYVPTISEFRDAQLTAPEAITGLTESDNSWTCDGSRYLFYVDLYWNIPGGNVFETFEVYVNHGTGYELVDVITKPEYRYFFEEANWEKEHKFKVLAVNSQGVKIELSNAMEYSTYAEGKTENPSDVEALFLNVTNETLQLDWEGIDDCDVDHYLIRFSPSLTATWEQSIPLKKIDASTTMTFVQARVGTYLIKAVDWGDRESDSAAIARTSIPSLVNLNVIEETNDFPSINGTVERVEKASGSLILQSQIAGPPQEYYEDGYYYYESLLDLGEIYPVRLQSLIEAEGYNEDDLMVNWVTLADVETLSSVGSSEWGVETEYRATNAYNVMSEWPSLSVIDPISEGLQDVWTDWRKFTIGDFTGRVFQFRLRLRSFLETVSPRIFDAIIRSDMPDRTESYLNIQSVAGDTKEVLFDPAFKATPEVQITQDAAQQGDYFQITNKSEEGFEIEFFDKNGVSVQRQFDVGVKGYGRLHDEVL